MSAQKPLLILFLLLVTGCAGRDFDRPQPGDIVLGKTTQAEVLQRFGTPSRKGTETINGSVVETISYAYAAGGASLVGGVTPGRSQAFHFLNGVVVGTVFISSFAADSTDFDAAKANAIAKGVTTRQQVLDLMGKPAGEYMYPMMDRQSDRGLVYSYLELKGTVFNPSISTKRLVVGYGPDDVVTDVKVSTSSPPR